MGVIETAAYGTVRPVAWEDGDRKAPSYPITGAAWLDPHGRLAPAIWRVTRLDSEAAASLE